MSNLESTRFPNSELDWKRLVEGRKGALRAFLTWAAECEADDDSLRLENRGDLERVKGILPLFNEAWWAVVVYTCFDSTIGTQAVASAFRHPVSPQDADRTLKTLALPKGSVQRHRTQPGNRGAKTALVSACARAEEFRRILHTRHGFNEHYEALRGLGAPQWGRTTCFDLLIRAGILGVAGYRYRPDRAYLYGSTGPSKGFTAIWGIEVSAANADRCEELLQGWSSRWTSVAAQVGVRWVGPPYDSADFENGLCIYQESGDVGCGKHTRVC